MKRQTIGLASGLILLFFFGACSKEDKTIDTEYPVIDVTAADAFPKQCSELKRGETVIFKAMLSDNFRLGSFSVDIHHNFDHHSHSTEVNDCGMEAVKAPVKPFLYLKSYSIPENLTSYATHVAIDIPTDIDPGDYHFMILLTDAEGWQSMKGLSIKIK